MTNNSYNNGRVANSDTGANFAPEWDDPIHIKGFSVTYDQKFNLGDYESLAPSVTIWVKTIAPEGVQIVNLRLQLFEPATDRHFLLPA